jgi:prepilin-type processing-associated H-X9-DG protein
MKTCPACAEVIPPDVSLCPLCGINIQEYAPPAAGAARGKMSRTTMTLIVVGCIFGMMLCCSPILVALLLPAVQQAREAARRSQCQNNLKQIGLALHNYADVNGTLPPAYVADADGKPLHSWRVLILPYLDQKPLYDSYNFSEPWDGPNNSRLLSQMPSVYRCPSDPLGNGSTHTAYAGVFGEHCIFRGSAPVGFRDITDGTSNTLLVGETDGAGIPWMKPDDINVELHPSIGDTQGFSSHHAGGVQFLMADGAVRFVSQHIHAPTLKSLFTRDGGEVIGDF